MASRLGIYTELELQAARDLVRELVRAIRGFRLYERDHPNLAGMLDGLRKKWDTATAGGPVSLRLTERDVTLDGESVYHAGSPGEMVPSVLYDHGIVGFVFKRGIEGDEARSLIRILGEDPEQGSDIASRLWEADLTHIQVLLDADEADEEWDTPEEMAQQVAHLGTPDDADAPTEPEGVAVDVEGLIAKHAAGVQPAGMLPAPGEFEAMRALVRDDDYTHTLRHAARVIHAIASRECTPEEAQVAENALRAVVGAIAVAGDLPGATELLERARKMNQSQEARVQRTGEATLAAFTAPPVLSQFLHALNRHDRLDARSLAECLAYLHVSSAALVAGWLLDTRHPRAVTLALRVFGPAAVEALVPLYHSSDARGRERIAPALLELGTAEALAAVGTEFASLPESHRVELVHVCERSEDPSLRNILLEALDDSSLLVRQAAVAGMRKSEALGLTPVVERLFEGKIFEERDNSEVEPFFRMIARVGNDDVARLLADHCLPKTFAQRFRGMTPLQQLSVNALRRMRSPAARALVEELRTRGARGVRDLLDDPMFGL